MNDLFNDAEFWVLIAFIVFIILVGRKAKSVTDTALDKRSNDIKEKINNTEEALQEAQKLLKSSQDSLIKHKKSSEKMIKDQHDMAIKNSKDYLINIDKEIERKKSSAKKEIEYIHSNAIAIIQEKISIITINTIKDLLSDDSKLSKDKNLFNNFIKEIPSALSYFKK